MVLRSRAFEAALAVCPVYDFEDVVSVYLNQAQN
jgi:hypothetical protein